MMKEKLYIAVALDENGNILDFDSTIEELEYEEGEVIGKNWFDIFIKPDNQLEVIKLFKENFYSEDLFNTNLWKHLTEIKTRDGHHKLIDFENSILIYENGKKALYSKGVEYCTNESDL